MEELRSTEILDKEIEADARKKVERILSKTEEECQKILGDVERRVREASLNKEEFYRLKFAQFEKNLESSLPLEKGRFLVAFYNDAVSDSLNEYLEKLGEDKRLLLVEKKLKNITQVLSEKKINAFVFGFKLSEAKKMLEKSLKKNLLKVEELSFEKSGEEAEAGNKFHEGIVLASDDDYVKIRLTIDQFIREIKDKYSEELAKTLFGGRLPE